MKQHKFKRMAIDLIERITNEQFQVDYKHDVIWFSHFDDSYDKRVKTFSMFNNLDDDYILLEKYEKAKKVIKGEFLIDE